MKVRPIFAWYDLWVGAFWDAKKRWLYIFPLPTLGIVIQFYPYHCSVCRKPTKQDAPCSANCQALYRIGGDGK